MFTVIGPMSLIEPIKVKSVGWLWPKSIVVNNFYWLIFKENFDWSVLFLLA